MAQGYKQLKLDKGDLRMGSKEGKLDPSTSPQSFTYSFSISPHLSIAIAPHSQELKNTKNTTPIQP